MTRHGYAILGDSAFVVDTRVNGGNIVRSCKSNETHGAVERTELAAVDLVIQRVFPTESLSTEWGQLAVKHPFGCLRLPLSADCAT